MFEEDKIKDKRKNTIIIVLAVVVFLIIATVAVVLFVLPNVNKKDTNEVAQNNTTSSTDTTSGMKIGAYVYYTPKEATYAWSAEYSSGPDITMRNTNVANTNENFYINRWKIFSIDKETNTVELISAKPTIGTVYLGGFEGYNNGVKLLNDACAALYSDQERGIAARSIQLKDFIVNMKEDAQESAVNYFNGYSTYNEKNAEPYTVNTFYPNIYPEEKKSTVNNTYNNVGLGSSEQDKFYKGITKANSLQPTQTFWSIPKNDLLSSFKGSGTGSSNEYYNIYFPDGQNSLYWIATRSVQIWTENCLYGMRYVGSGEISAHWTLSSIENTSGDAYYSIRPIITVDASKLTQTGDTWRIN